jgi:hypothetical protein
MIKCLSFVCNLITQNQTENLEVQNINTKEEARLAQLEECIMADDNQGISNLGLYLYGG